MRPLQWILMLSISGSWLCAQEVPSGWKVVKDKQGACQLAVPNDWVADKIVSSFMQSPDHKSSAVPHGARAGQTFEQVTTTAKMVIKPAKIMEDTGKRLWYEYPNSTGAPGTNWYVAVPGGKQVCTADVTFKDAAGADTAKKIVLSLTPAK